MLNHKQKKLGINLGLKVAVFIVLITVLPFFLVMILILNTLGNASLSVEKKALEQTSSLVEQELANSVSAKAEIYDLTFKNMEIDLDGLKNRINEEGFRKKLLSEYFYKHQLISSVYFVDATGSIYVAPEMDIFRQEKVDIFHMKEFDFLTSKNAHLGRWIGPYSDFKSQLKIVSYVLPIWRDNKFEGVAAFDISIDDIFKKIVSIDPSRSSYFFIIKENGEFFSSSEQIFADFMVNKSNSNLLESPVLRKYSTPNIFAPTGEKEGVFTILVDAENTKKIVAFSVIPSFGGKVVTVSPLSEIIQVQQEKAQEIQRAVNQVGVNSFFYIFVLAAFIVFSSFYLFRKGIIFPIAKLRQGIENIEKTGFSSKINVKSNDEFGELAISFNTMAENLKKSRDELEKYNKNLEKTIAERTKELENSKKDLISKVEDLEKFNKLAVDRELKMVELKTKIKELEEWRKV